MGNPFPLKANSNKSFQGSIVLGKGFIITPEQAKALIAKDKRNKDVLFPYLNGDDLNNDPMQRATRWVINFFDWTEERARTYPDCFAIVEQFVKPERLAQNDKGGREKWWRFLRPRNELYETISKLDQVMAINRHAKHLLISIGRKDIVYSEATIVFALSSYYHYALLSSSIHEIWAWKNSSTMGVSTLRYSASKAFETFPFPSTQSLELEKLGYELHTLRKEVMAAQQIGLTELQNRYHSNNDRSEHIQDIRNICRTIDYAVLSMYGWDDIKLNHDFYEMEYLPETDRIRYTIYHSVRKEMLKRLLQLNHKLHKTEIELQSVSMNKHKAGNSTQIIDLFSKE